MAATFATGAALLVASYVESAQQHASSSLIASTESSSSSQHKRQLEDLLFSAITNKFALLNEYTQLSHRIYHEGMWGIASTEQGSQNYGYPRHPHRSTSVCSDSHSHIFGSTRVLGCRSAKTRFIFDQLMARMAVLPPNLTICETGFNAGHSAMLFLDALPNSRLVEFDLGDFAWAVGNAAMLNRTYGPARFEYVKGDSAVTIPRHLAARRGRGESEAYCDVLFVDGRKGVEGRRGDVMLMRSMAKPGALVFGDEANTVECMSGKVDKTHEKCKMHWDTEWAWNELVRNSTLSWHACSEPSAQQGLREDIVCLWAYI